MSISPDQNPEPEKTGLNPDQSITQTPAAHPLTTHHNPLPYYLGGVLLAVLILIFIGYQRVQSKKYPIPPAENNSTASTSTPTPSPTATSNATPSSTSAPTASTGSVGWEWNGSNWVASGTAPSCEEPLIPELPVDSNKVSTILYPGQIRGSNYKAHGGFLFKSSYTNSDITVTAPLDATLVQASNYTEIGEVQYLLEFVNSCGIMYRFDHLYTLSPAMQEALKDLPAPLADDSRTTKLSKTVMVKKGDVIATSVGFVKNKNVSVDFGVYDLRTANTASQKDSFRSDYQNVGSLAFHGLCWLETVPQSLSAQLKALPGSGTEGKVSDYCQ